MNHLDLELARTKLTISHLAREAELPDAQKLLAHLNETVVFLKRRIDREKIVANESQTKVNSASLTI